MVKKKKKPNRPWLTPSDVERPTAELKDICKSWDAQTWANYLNWYESGQSEKMITPSLYTKISEEIDENIFSEFGSETKSTHIELCHELLSALPQHQQQILKLIYFEGRTLVYIAKFFKRSPASIHQNKFKALTTLKRVFDGKILNARHYIEGHEDLESQKINSLWDEKLSSPIYERRSYHEINFKNELARHKTPELREVFSEILDLSLEIIYLRFFCDLSLRQISRKKYLAPNTVDQIIDATVFKVKSTLIKNLAEDKASANGQQGSRLA